MRSMSPSAWRPAVSIESSASRASSGFLSMTRCAAPACRTTTLSAWPTLSWSSRAMRARSSATASRARTSRSAAKSAARRSARSMLPR